MSKLADFRKINLTEMGGFDIQVDLAKIINNPRDCCDG